MRSHDEQERQRRSLRTAVPQTRLTLEQLWHRYFALGGTAGLLEVDAFLQGLMPLPDLERDLLAHAVNERLDDLTGRARATYSFPLRAEVPRTGPLAAVLHLLSGTRLAPPERLAAATRAAGEAIGVEMGVFLVDYEQQVLHPVSTGGAGPAAQPVDTTLAGQCFRSTKAVAHGADLWIPLLDGAERVGVLHVRTADAGANDKVLREQCTWLGQLIGHLVVATSSYGDALEAVRRTQRRSASAELIWNLLPPLTAASERVTLAAVMHPVYGLGGDAFDYDLSESTARVGIFDATGHDLGAGLTVAAAISAYRGARHHGAGLIAQVMSINDAVIERSSSGEDFVTGVLAELDLHSGRLRYVVAGHPPPLLIRNGQLVKRLDDGDRPLLGLDHDSLRLGEEVLEADDWLLFYTDGIPEARDSDGRYFGEERLVDLLRREILSGNSAAETVRRLSRAIMKHQGGELQDDATVLLLQWTPTPRRTA